jgi:hypothetical protein
LTFIKYRERVLLQYRVLGVHKVLLQTREAKHPPAQKFIVFKLGIRHPPTHSITALAPLLVPPLNRNNKTLLFPHLQQHGFETLSMKCTFASLTCLRKKTLKDMVIKVKLIKIQRLFCRKAYYEWILKNSFYLSG